MPEEIVERKRRLRREIRDGRDALTEDQRSAAGNSLTARLIDLAESSSAQSLACFLPTRNEPDTRGFLRWAEAQGVDTLLPSAREDGLLDWIRPSGDGTVTGAFGIDEPLGEFLSPLAVDEVDLMLIPAAAADVHGNRLGWGRGYFDRTLNSMARRPPVFAVVYDHEVVEQLPTEPHDAPLTGVVTPDRVVRF